MTAPAAPVTTARATDAGRERTAARVQLLVVGDGHVGTYAVPDDAELVLGRDRACGIAIEHRRISRRHARVRAGAEAAARGCVAMVEDLGSTNGVFVRGERLAPHASALLQLGDTFQVGPFTAIVMAGGPATEVAPPGDDEARAAIAIADPTPAGLPAIVARLAQSTVSVLILGETGSGKEVLARAVHQLSRRPGPFVGINAAALSESLLESELFGHERGAFTGATQAKRGLLETAPQGTVFLDEIGELPRGLQAKLLRALETRTIYRVGGLKPIALDVRFLAATHRDLAADAAAGRFRRDLYYRLDGVTLRIVPLRERRDAIPRLAAELLAEVAAAAGQPVPGLTAAALDKLGRHAWPGNVRELRAVIERALVMREWSEIDARAIRLDGGAGAIAARRRGAPTMEAFLTVARHHRGNVTQIARELGTSRSHVHRLAQRFGVDLGAVREP